MTAGKKPSDKTSRRRKPAAETLGGGPIEAPAKVGSTPSFVVGVGASAGGLEALGRFFAPLPADCGLAFVVVQHLSPDHKSFMVELLSKKTALAVVRAEDGARVQPGTVYLIPPRRNIRISKGCLQLVDPPGDRLINLPIDIFFRALADDQQDRAIGVVLSGTGSDGTLGIRAIKDAGGMVMVQSESSALFDGMPRSAIGTGLADFIAPPEEMARLLLSYVKHPLNATERGLSRGKSNNETLMQRLIAHLRERHSVDFSCYRPATIDRRIERRMTVNQIGSLRDYIQHLETSPRESDLLFSDLLICVTRFFRDREAFDILRDKVIPAIIDGAAAGEQVRVWVPGCSMGEEPYSLAILFSECMEAKGKSVDVKIFATDIVRDAIETGSQGVYTPSMVADIPRPLLAKYFTEGPKGYTVNTGLRRMVVFARHDLLKDPPFTKLDLISCRNLLIYLHQGMQAKVLAAFHFALKPGGYLFLGSSESLGDLQERFNNVSIRHKIYQKRPGSHQSFVDPRSIPAWRPAMPSGPLTTGRLARQIDVKASVEAICKEVMEDYAPACIVVDEHHEVLYLFGNAGTYLSHPPGTPTNNLLKLTAKTLAPALAPALHRAARDASDITYEKVRFRQDGQARVVSLRVRPLRQQVTNGQTYLVFITDRTNDATPGASVEMVEFDETASQRIRELEQELTYTKESLQATVEELETANEELQASNEELLAANEELQSTNEELQSVNEELHTVNSENEHRIVELLELTNDINNLLAATNVGTLLLDETLRIRRASKAMGELTPLTDADVGAPIEVLDRLLGTTTLSQLARAVQANGQPAETEIELPGPRHLLIRMAAYRTEINSIRGIVVTLIELTRQRTVESQLAASQALSDAILNALPARVAVLAPDGTIIRVNRAWEDFARVNGGMDRCGLSMNYLAVCDAATGESRESATQCAAALRDILAGRRDGFELVYPCHSPTTERWFLVHMSPLDLTPSRHVIVLHTDITHLLPKRD
jgi:two-component system CheB/CheR fusion protein